MKFDTSNSDHQRALQAFVQREVVYCVSQLVHELTQRAECIDDEIGLEILIRDDWQSAAEDEGWLIYEDTDGLHAAHDEHRTLHMLADDEPEAWRELCEHESIDPHQIEALEHWIVSDYLARELESRGEMISFDFYGLTVRGRATSGQAIYIDSVIAGIASGFDNGHWVCRMARGESE